ncbi:MAG: hypothetical protein LBN00_01455 [Oscillospiraceae bacterium]|nr:hypothetical protein [Oscillospiraceae bacterium]
MNRFDIREQDDLTSVEREITFAKTLYLQANPAKGVLDLTYLQKIHKFIFEDVYTWAGEAPRRIYDQGRRGVLPRRFDFNVCR